MSPLKKQLEEFLDSFKSKDNRACAGSVVDCFGCSVCKDIKSCDECYDCYGCDNCHNCVGIGECSDCHVCESCLYCLDCRLCTWCSNCENCDGCQNSKYLDSCLFCYKLEGTPETRIEFHVFNKPVSKEEWLETLKRAREEGLV